MVHRWVVWSVAVLLLVPAGLASAQHPPKLPAGAQAKGRGQAQGKNPHPRGQPPPSAFQRLREVPPQEQERLMASEQFRRLPPERQQQIRENLKRWNAMTPEQTAAFTPEQVQYLQ